MLGWSGHVFLSKLTRFESTDFASVVTSSESPVWTKMIFDVEFLSKPCPWINYSSPDCNFADVCTPASTKGKQWRTVLLYFTHIAKLERQHKNTCSSMSIYKGYTNGTRCEHSILWNAITHSCLRYLHLVPKSLYICNTSNWIYTRVCFECCSIDNCNGVIHSPAFFRFASVALPKSYDWSIVEWYVEFFNYRNTTTYDKTRKVYAPSNFEYKTHRYP